MPPHAYNLNRYNMAITLPVHEYSLCVLVLHFVLQTFVVTERPAVVMCILNTTISLAIRDCEAEETRPHMHRHAFPDITYTLCVYSYVLNV